MSKILVTGATGTLGRILRELLNEHEIRVLQGDICDLDSLRQQIDSDLQKVIHLAALVPVSDVNRDPQRAYQVNCVGTLNLVRVLQEKNIQPWFFYASTSHVYAESNEPLFEDSRIAPRNIYGRTKFIGESMVQDCYGGPSCIGRIFSYYDENQQPPFLYANIRQRLENENLDEPFELFGADSYRDFLSAKQVCELITQLVQAEAEGVINIASGKGTRIRDFVQNLSPKPLNIVPKGNNDSIVADITKLQSFL